MEYTPPSEHIFVANSVRQESVLSYNGVSANDIAGGGYDVEEDEHILYRCPTCSKVFLNENEFEVHECGSVVDVNMENGLESIFPGGEIMEIIEIPEEELSNYVECNGVVDSEEFILGLDNHEEAFMDCVSDLNNPDGELFGRNTGPVTSEDNEVQFIEEVSAPAKPVPRQLGLTDRIKRAAQLCNVDEKRANGNKVLGSNSTIDVQRHLEENLPVKLEALNKPDLYSLIKKKVVRICLDDIALSYRKTCEFCCKQIQLIKFNQHQQDEHSEALALRNVRNRDLRKQRKQRTRSGSCGSGSSSVTSSSSDAIRSTSSSRRLNGTFSFNGNSEVYSKRSENKKAARKMYHCQYCSKTFVAQGQCKSHENTHTNHQVIVTENSSDKVVQRQPEESTSSEKTQLIKTEKPSQFEITMAQYNGNCMSGSDSASIPEQALTTVPGKPRKSSTCSSLENMKENIKSPTPTPTEEIDDGKLVRCKTCGEEVATPVLLNHIYSHLQKRQRSCSLCDHVSYTKVDLKDHLHSKHYGLKPHICSICKRGFGWASGLRWHEDSCHKESFKCKYCKRKFDTNRERRRHELVHKNISGPSQGQFSQIPPNGARKGDIRGNRRMSTDKDVLKTKHNIQSKRLQTPSPPLGTITTKMASPEINSILENYVCNGSNFEQIIEIDLMKEEEYGKSSFMASLTKPTSFPCFNERDSVVAFAMTSSGPGGGGTADGTASSNYQVWPTNNDNNNATNNYANHHVVMMAPPNNSSVMMPLPQQRQQQMPQQFTDEQLPIMQQQIARHLGGQSNNQQDVNSRPETVSMDSSGINQVENNAVNVSPSLAGDDEVGEDGEEEEDDEYYRDEDKKYVEPPDTRITETCKTCGLVIPIVHLRDHIQSHVPKGQLECSICNYKAFNGKYLLDHLNIHYALKPYECEKCGRHFTFHGYLRSHIKQVHMKSKDRPHECRYCDKKFVRPCHRRAHERSHKGEIPKANRPPSDTSSSTTPPIPTPPVPLPSLKPVPVFKTPTKSPNPSLDPAAELLLSSPANIQPKMTSTWPPMNPHHQDPWLNPIHSDSRINNMQQQQPYAQHRYSLPNGSNTDGGLYYNYQSNAPSPLYQHSSDPKLYQPPTPTNTANYMSQHQQQNQNHAIGSQFTSPPFSTNPHQTHQQHQIHQSTPQMQQQQQASWSTFSNSYSNSVPSTQFYNQQPSNYNYNSFESTSTSSTGSYNTTYNMNILLSSTATQSNNSFYQSQTTVPSLSTTTAPNSSYELSDLGLGLPSSTFDTSEQPPDYSISAPQNFDLWAELRDEELKLFAETGPLNDTFASSAYTRQSGLDDLLFGTPNQHVPSYSEQQSQLSIYAVEYPSNALPTTSVHISSNNFDQKVFQQQLSSDYIIGSSSDSTKIKVKVKRIQGQVMLVHPKPKSLKSESQQLQLQPQASTSISPSGSREMIPTGGRRLSSDDLDEKLDELTNKACLICHQTFSAGSKDILEHISSHLERGQVHCPVCDKSFAHSWYLKVHTYKHYGIKLYECTYCHRKFSKRHSLAAHIEQTHSHNTEMVNSQVCEFCKKSYNTRFALKRHQKTVHNVELKRDPLARRGNGRGGASSRNNDIRLYRPKHLMHDIFKRSETEELDVRMMEQDLTIFSKKWTVAMEDIGTQTTLCPICKEHINIKDMLTHKTEHTEDCHICGKTVLASELISHGSTHVSTLVCEICNWKGKQKSQLWEHMNGHLGCKPLKCEYCGVGFASRSSVRLHTIARHTNIRLHKCDFCDARFVTPQVKRMHQLQHYDTNCPFCNKYFPLKRDLGKHVRLHYKMAGQKLVLKENLSDDDGQGKQLDKIEQQPEEDLFPGESQHLAMEPNNEFIASSFS